MSHSGEQSPAKIALDRSSSDFSVKLFEHLRQLTYDLAKNPDNAKKWSFLRYYQNIIREYFNTIELKSRGLLVFLPPGMGKTLAAVAVAVDQMEERFPIILASKSLHENFHVGIKKYIKMRTSADPLFALGKIPEGDLDKWIARNFGFVSMNASNMIDQLVKESEGQVGKEFRKVQTKVERKRVKEGQYKSAVAVGSLDDKMLIVDEAHNLFRAITNGSKNGIELYNMIMKAKGLKILFLTGTMPVNDPFEFVPCFNMLAETEEGTTLFPESYSDFRRMFISERKIGIEEPDDAIGVSKLKMINKDKFQNRIYGLVSRVGYNTMLGKGIIDMAKRQGENIEFTSIGLTGESQPVNFPKVLPLKVRFIPMTKKQYSMYLIARNKELEEYKVKRFRRGSAPVMQKPKSMSASTYKQKSRQMSNFAPPADLGLVRFSEIDMDKIDEKDVESVKLDALYKEIMAQPGIGYVYSQFVGAGGLGSIMRYLEKKGWKIFGEQKRIITGKPPKKTHIKITTAIPSDFADVVADTSSDVNADTSSDVNADTPADTEGGMSKYKKRRIADFEEYIGRAEELPAHFGGNNTSISLPTIYFVVNGQTDLCAEGRQIGASDAGLNERGKEQAMILAKELKDMLEKNNVSLYEIIVSTSTRSHNLFNILQSEVAAIDMKNLKMSDGLSPRNGGILDGMKKETVAAVLEEVGRIHEEGLKSLTYNFIIDSLENLREMLRAKRANADIIADINKILTMPKDEVTEILAEEETEEEFKARVQKEVDGILSKLQKKIKKSAAKPEAILIIAPNGVYTTAASMIYSALKDKEKIFEEMAPTKIKKIRVKQSDISTIESSMRQQQCGIAGGADKYRTSSKMMLFVDSIIGDIKKDICEKCPPGTCISVIGGASAQKTDQKSHSFAYFSGEVDVEDREKIRVTFNAASNAKEGESIRTLLLSATGAEGLDLENARYGIAYEPYWVWPRLEQVFARGVRHNSHIGLPKEDQNFQPILFIAVKPGTDTVDYAEYVKRMVAGMPQPGDEDLMTTDLELYIESLITNDLNKQFAEAVYEISIECVLNGEDNCRMCAPTGAKLFGPDIDADMRKPSACEKYVEESIEALEIVVDGVKYFYSPDPSSIFKYKLYEYDSELGNYREMNKSNDLYSQIVDAIDAHNKK